MAFIRMVQSSRSPYPPEAATGTALHFHDKEQTGSVQKLRLDGRRNDSATAILRCGRKLVIHVDDVGKQGRVSRSVSSIL